MSFTDRHQPEAVREYEEHLRTLDTSDQYNRNLVGRRYADAAIVALLERWEECERRFDLAVEKCERMIARAEKAEADARGWADSFKQAEQSIVELQAEVEEAWACVEGYKQTAEEERAEVERLRGLHAHEAAKNFQYEAEKAQPGLLLAEVERLKWMLDDAVRLNNSEWLFDLADLAARYEQEQRDRCNLE